MRNRVVLGTAQFGMRYGISNRTGRVDAAEATAILRRARRLGIDTVDTAIAYGESERTLGDIGMLEWKVISKLPPVPDSCGDAGDWVRESVRGSLRRLGASRLHALLLHRSQDLLGPRAEAVGSALLAIKREGEVEKVGVSIYEPAELDAIGTRFPLDIVQAPLNVLDRRIVTSGWLERLRDAGTEFHARSVFLQGLLLMAPGERPSGFERWRTLWNRWDLWLREHSQSPLQSCLAFVLNQANVDRIVVGVVNEAQLEQIAGCLDAPSVTPPPDLATVDPELINPSRWSTA